MYIDIKIICSVNFDLGWKYLLKKMYILARISREKMYFNQI